MLNFTLETASAPTSTIDSSVDLTNIPEEYHKFANVFSKNWADTLAPHQPYDLHINLEEGAPLPLGQVYSLSKTEWQALREFLDENLWSGFIWKTWSPLGALILFIQMKDGSLLLCVDFHRLNKITKKDCYPLLLTKDLLDAPGKARIYMKIDLWHAYHLVHITKGDKWKTAFQTQYGSYEWCVMPPPHSNISWMTFSLTFLMLQSSCIWTTSSSTLTTLRITGNTSKKYLDVSGNTDFTAVPKKVLSTRTLLSI
jgi:hypothetical protein